MVPTAKGDSEQVASDHEPMAALVGGLMAVGYLVVKVVRRWARPASITSGSGLKDSIPYAPAISLGVLLSFLSELN